MIAELAAMAATLNPVEQIYDTCLGRAPESQQVEDYWDTHPDPSSAICTSPEAIARLEARGLVHFSSSTWMPAVMADVRWCESRGNYTAENPTSTASGGWQFLDSTWAYVTGLEPPASAYSRETQDRAAAKLLAMAGGNPGSSMGWLASRGCWG